MKTSVRFGGDYLLAGEFQLPVAELQASSCGSVVVGKVEASNRSDGESFWICWSATTGSVLQTFVTGDYSEGVLVETLLICTPVQDGVVEAWDVITGELRWRRDDFVRHQDLWTQIGTADGRAAVRVKGDSRHYLLWANTGRNVVGSNFVEDKVAVSIPSFEAIVPPFEGLPCSVIVRNRAFMADELNLAQEPTPLEKAILASLKIRSSRQSASSELPSPVEHRSLEPSPGIARQLGILLRAEDKTPQATISGAEAAEILNFLPGASDDLLCVFAARSQHLQERWHISVRELGEICKTKQIRQTPRLLPFGYQGNTTLMLHDADGPDRVGVVAWNHYYGPEPLLKWLSDVTWKATKGNLESLDVNFAIGEDGRFVNHLKFGKGRVLSEEGGILEISFPEHGIKKIKAVYVAELHG